MPQLIQHPSQVPAVGEPPKVMEEYVGRVSTGDAIVSVARTHSPVGWGEPGQRPEFDEFTIVLHGELRVEFEGGVYHVSAGQAVHAQPQEWVRYSTPDRATEYISICLPAFAAETVRRDGLTAPAMTGQLTGAGQAVQQARVAGRASAPRP